MNRRRDEKFIRVALKEAKKALGRTSPNPAVGAVLVVDNQIVAKGHHRGAGRNHAEVECLRNFGARVPARATLYVTLEPCSTAGRTAPCTDAILSAGVRNVVVGAIDVNPRHSGKGIVRLRNAGLSVRAGVLADECAQINEAFNKWIVTGRPFVIAKCGMSLDGRLTRPAVEPRWITGRSARSHARELRAHVDAVLVGAETVRADISDRLAARTLIYKGQSLAGVLKKLGKRGMTNVLIEGGGELLSQALDARLIDKVQLYLGPILTGGPVIAFAGRGATNAANALRLGRVSYQRIGQSVCITGYPDSVNWTGGGGFELCCGAAFRCSRILQHWIRTGLWILPLRLLLSVPLLPAVLRLLPALLLVRRAPLLPSPPSPSLLSVLSQRRIQKVLIELAGKQFRASTF